MLQKFWQLFIICFSILIYVLEKGELDWYISKGTSITLQFFHFKHCSVFFYFYYSTLSEEMQLYYIMIFIILYVNLPLFPFIQLAHIVFIPHIHTATSHYSPTHRDLVSARKSGFLNSSLGLLGAAARRVSTRFCGSRARGRGRIMASLYWQLAVKIRNRDSGRERDRSAFSRRALTLPYPRRNPTGEISPGSRTGCW